MPDPTPLQPSFWDNEENALWSVLVSIFVETMMDGFQGGIDLLPPDIAVLIDFDVVNQAALDYARRYRYEWIKSITETTRTQVQPRAISWSCSLYRSFQFCLASALPSTLDVPFWCTSGRMMLWTSRRSRSDYGPSSAKTSSRPRRNSSSMRWARSASFRVFATTTEFGLRVGSRCAAVHQPSVGLRIALSHHLRLPFPENQRHAA